MPSWPEVHHLKPNYHNEWEDFAHATQQYLETLEEKVVQLEADVKKLASEKSEKSEKSASSTDSKSSEKSSSKKKDKGGTSESST